MNVSSIAGECRGRGTYVQCRALRYTCQLGDMRRKKGKGVLEVSRRDSGSGENI